MIKKLAKFTRGYRGYTVITPILVMLEVAIEVTLPFVISKIIDVGINGGGGAPYVIKLGIIMAVMALFSLVFGGLAGRTCAVASVGFGANLRKALFSKVQDFSFANTDKFPTASLVTRLTTDVNNTQTAYMMILRMLVRSPMMFISATAFAISINAKLALVFAVAVPVLAVTIITLLKITYPRFITLLKRYDGLNESVQENLTGIRVVKTFVREEHESGKFNNSSALLKKAHISAEKLMVTGMPMMMLVIYSCIIAVLYLGGGYIVKGALTTGELTSFLTYIMQILMSLLMLAVLLVMTVMSRASVTRIVEVLDETVDITDDGAELTEVADGSVEFVGVDFSYSKRNDNIVLGGVNLKIESGQTIGIIGGTGASKTTLVQLIPRLYDATNGAVKVGGRDVREYKINALRQSVAMVLQKNVLFSGTIKENLLWGDPEATDEEIEKACRDACAYDFITDFPEGFNTNLGQGGVNLSGGQKQRICIARALMKKPKIIILDDSTSAVDTATDANIRKALRQGLKGLTSIIIAQRILSVMDADKIVVLDNGKVAAFGTHSELLSTCEIYREVYSSQIMDGEDK